MDIVKSSDMAAYQRTKTTMKPDIQSCMESHITSTDAAKACIQKTVGLSASCSSCWIDEENAHYRNAYYRACLQLVRRAQSAQIELLSCMCDVFWRAALGLPIVGILSTFI